MEPRGIHILGAGKPTWVFEAGMGNWSVFFRPVAQELARVARVCLIDRRGYGRPLAQGVPRDAETLARELHEDLEAAGIGGPLILAGHSLGGLSIRMYQNLYPERVAGMALIDAAHPDLWARIPGLEQGLRLQIRRMRRLIPPAKWGLLRLARTFIPTFGLPAPLLPEYLRIACGAEYFSTYVREMESLGASLAQCGRLPGLGMLPLLVVASQQGLNPPGGADGVRPVADANPWLGLQLALAGLSADSRFVLSGADHFLHVSEAGRVARALIEFHADMIRKETF